MSKKSKREQYIVQPGEELPSEVFVATGGKKPKTQLELMLEKNEQFHYNYLAEFEYRVSSGSLDLDLALDGGFPPGIHRFTGSSEGGKTSEALEVAANFLETVPNSKVFYIKAEGRLSKSMKRRSRLKFVTNAADWDVGTCFIFKCNVYEVIAQMIYDFVKINDGDFKYMFIIDSLDGVIRQADLEKSFTESNQVAAVPTLTKLLFKKVSLPISEIGHLMIVITQVTGKIEIKYEKKDQLAVSGSGNGAIHFANFILEFLPRWKKDFIVNDNKDVNLTFGESNVVGHKVHVELLKSENEKTKQTVTYPVKYSKEEDGSRIWNELEIKTSLIRLQLVNFKGAWGNFSESAIQKMEAAGIKEIPAKFHGESKFNDYVSKPEVLKFWKSTLQNYILSKDML